MEWVTDNVICLAAVICGTIVLVVAIFKGHNPFD